MMDGSNLRHECKPLLRRDWAAWRVSSPGPRVCERDCAAGFCQQFPGLFYLHDGLDNRSIPGTNKTEQVIYGVIEEYREEHMTSEKSVRSGWAGVDFQR